MASILAAIPVAAATFKAGEVVSLSVPIADDVYAAGGSVNLSEDFPEDLLEKVR